MSYGGGDRRPSSASHSNFTSKLGVGGGVGGGGGRSPKGGDKNRRASHDSRQDSRGSSLHRPTVSLLGNLRQHAMSNQHMHNQMGANANDDENNKEDCGGNLSVGEEAELNEFCETSSWETNSTPDEEEMHANGGQSAGSNFLMSLKNSLSAANV